MAIIQSKLHSLAITEPVIGLEFLTEYQFKDCFLYECTLCNVSLKDRAMSLHMIGHRHRIAHMKKFHLEKYKKVVEKHLSTTGGRPKGAVWSQLFRDYAIEISTYRNGAFLMGKVKVSKVNYCRFKENSKHNDQMLDDQMYVQHVDMNVLSKEIFHKERQLQKREQILTNKEISLNEMQRTNDEKVHTTLQNLFQGAEDPLADLTQQFKNNPDASLTKAEEFIIQESLINDAHKRNAQREVELILKLTSSDKKLLYILMLQRKRHKASLQRLENMVGSDFLSHNEEMIKSQLVGALQKLKSEGRKILSNALWLDNDEQEDTSCSSKNQTESSSLLSLDGTFPRLTTRKSEDDWAEVNYTSFEKTTVKADISSRVPCKTSEDYLTPQHQQPTACFSHLEQTVLENPTSHLPISIQSSNDQYNKHQPSDSYFGLEDKFESDTPEINIERRLTKSNTKFDLHHEINYKATTSNSSFGNSIKMTVGQTVTTDSQDGAALSEGLGTSEMEDKIFQSLCKGSLAPIAKAFSDNPTLQAALKTWEGSQKEEPEPQHNWIEKTGHSQQEDFYYDGDHQQYQPSNSKILDEDYWTEHHNESDIDELHYEGSLDYENPEETFVVKKDFVSHDRDPCDAHKDQTHYERVAYPIHHQGQRDYSYHEQDAIRKADIQTHFEKAWGQEKNLHVLSNLKKVVKPVPEVSQEKTPLLSKPKALLNRVSHKRPTGSASGFEVPRFPQRLFIRNPRHMHPRHVLRPNMPHRYSAPGAPRHSLAPNFQTSATLTRPPRFGAVVPRQRFEGPTLVRGLLRLPRGLPPNRGLPGQRLLKRKLIRNTSAPFNPRNPYSPSDFSIKRPLLRKVPLLQNPESNIS